MQKQTITSLTSLDNAIFPVLRIHQELHGMHTKDYYAIDVHFDFGDASSKKPVFTVNSNSKDSPTLVLTNGLGTGQLAMYEMTLAQGDNGVYTSVMLQHVRTAKSAMLFARYPNVINFS